MLMAVLKFRPVTAGDRWRRPVALAGLLSTAALIACSSRLAVAQGSYSSPFSITLAPDIATWTSDFSARLVAIACGGWLVLRRRTLVRRACLAIAFVVPGVAEAEEKREAAAAPIRVAIYDDEGVGSAGPTNLERCLSPEQGFATQRVKGGTCARDASTGSTC